MEVVFAPSPFPSVVKKTLFLAGPTQRGGSDLSWRKEALALLEELGFDGHVFVPEPQDFQAAWDHDYDQQVEWEAEGLEKADCILFWVPRDISGETYGVPMPGFTTNDEWGVWKASGKVVWGAPDWADKVKYQEHYAKKLGVPMARTLREALQKALDLLGTGSVREGGETWVPLFVWQRQDFQDWYQSQVSSGNYLNSAKVVWTLWAGEKLFLYAMHLNVHITAEGRDKTIESAVFRQDVSVVCLYRPKDPLSDSQVVLVKEFRTPVRNDLSYVYELPGGSSHAPGKDPLQVAADEVSEEVGLTIESSRLRPLGVRQMGATLCAYHAHLFSVELTEDEMAKLAADTSTHGENAEERTTIVVRTVQDILDEDLVDWPMLGMIFETFGS